MLKTPVVKNVTFQNIGISCIALLFRKLDEMFIFFLLKVYADSNTTIIWEFLHQNVKLT